MIYFFTILIHHNYQAQHQLSTRTSCDKMTSSLFIWIEDKYSSRIYREYDDKYIIKCNNQSYIELSNNKINDIIFIKHTQNTYICLGKVISFGIKGQNTIAIRKINDFGCHSKSKLTQLVTSYMKKHIYDDNEIDITQLDRLLY